MSMQDRLNKVHEYIQVVQIFLDSIHRLEEQLSSMTKVYQATIETQRVQGYDVLYVELNDMKFETCIERRGVISYKGKGFPASADGLDKKDGGHHYVSMDDVLYVICNIEQFMNKAFIEIMQGGNETSC